MSDPFDDPQRVAINRVYTGKGDAGTTQLVGGQKVAKSAARIAAYGAVDELNAFVGAAIVEAGGAAGELELADVLAAEAEFDGDWDDDALDALDEMLTPTIEGIDPVEELDNLQASLLRVQHQLFNLGSILATLPEDVHPKQPRIRESDAAWLESEMDRCNAVLEPLRSFVLPGGSRLNTDLHVCRTVARRVEREVCALAETESVDSESLIYLNRLSDAFFVWSRWANALMGNPETLWDPNAAGS